MAVPGRCVLDVASQAAWKLPSQWVSNSLLETFHDPTVLYVPPSLTLALLPHCGAYTEVTGWVWSGKQLATPTGPLFHDQWHDWQRGPGSTAL